MTFCSRNDGGFEITIVNGEAGLPSAGRLGLATFWIFVGGQVWGRGLYVWGKLAAK